MLKPLPFRTRHIAQFLTIMLMVVVTASYVNAATYYSFKASAPFETNFSSTTNWNTNPAGGGANPTAGDLTSGAHIFIVQDGYTVTLDMNASVNTITIGTGSGANLVFGDNTTARTLTVGAGGMNVGTGSNVTVSNNNAVHSLLLNGQLTVNGTLNLRNNSAQVVNTTTSGTYSITGSGPLAQFNNLTVGTGTVTAGRALTIRGNVAINTGSTLVGGAFTHTVFGNWSQTGTGTYNSTNNSLEFANTLIQTISTAATFNNVAFIGGGSVSISGNLTVNGNFSVTGNTTISTPSTHVIAGNFSVAPTATFTATAGTVTFSGTSSQTIDLLGTVTFNALTFSNGGVGSPKNINGNLSVNSALTINGAPTAAHVTGSGNHVFRQNVTMNGTAAFSGSVTLQTGTLQNTLASAISFGTAAITLNGALTLAVGDDWTVNNSVSLNTGSSLIVNNTSTLNDASGTGTFTMAGTASLFVRGANNFPSGFASYSLASTTSQRYDANFAQTIRGGLTYGALFAQFNTKTVDGPLTITGNLDLNSTVTLDLGNFSHTFRGATIVNSGTRNGSITSASGGNFTFDGTDINQILNTSGTGTYTFHDLTFVQPSTPTAVRTRTIQGSATVNGNLSISNAAGDAVNLLVIDLGANQLTKGAPSGDISLGANCVLSTSGASNLANTIASFSTTNFNVASITRFNGTNQNIPAGTYGTIQMSGNGNKTALGTLDVNGDFVRTANNSVFVGGAFTHTVAGNWNLNSTTLFTATGTTIVLDGADQTVFLSNFENLTFAGTGTKTLAGNLTITGNVAASGAITIDGNTRQLTLHGDWSNSGGSVVTQTTGSLIIVGNSATPQTFSTTAASQFGSITLQRPNVSVNRTFQLLTNVQTLGAFTFSSGTSTNSNELNLNGFTLSVGANFTFQGASVFTAGGGTLVLNGAGNQTLQNTAGGANYFNIEFAGGGTKTIAGATLNVANNFNINGPTVTSGITINVAGNWINSGTYNGTGTNTVVFNGTGAQSIGSSTFQNLTISGTGVATLAGNITVAGSITISNNSTLDVSASNFAIICDNNFTIAGGSPGGTFVPRAGTVTMTSTGTINTGGLGVGKEFFNLTIAVGSGNTSTIGSAVRVTGNVEISSGTLAMNTFGLTVSGDFTNNSLITSTGGVLTLDASSGTRTFTPGGSTYGPVTINALGGTVNLGGNLTLAGTRVFTMTAGTFSLNGFALNMAANLTMTGGTFDINAGAALRMSNGNAINVSGGNFMVVGTPSQVANLTLNGASGNYTFSMTGGTFHARFYTITNTSGNGIVLSGAATIDATNNLSNGTFSNSIGTSYLTLTGITFPSYTASGIVFNAGPTSNVTRSSGSGKLTIEDALGARAGNGFRGVGTTNAFVEFILPAGAVSWDGGAGTSNWNDALNWSNDVVPTAATLVYLDHTFVGATYTVNITSAPAVAGRVVLDAGGGNPISLVLNGQTLTVSGSVVVNTNTTLTQTNPADVITLSGNWLVNGTFNEGTSTVVFNGSASTSTITTGGIADPFNNLTFNASGATYVFGSAIRVAGTYSQAAGVVDVSINNIEVAGNWSFTGGTLNPRIATITFNGAGAQAISGGSFFNFTTGGGGTKTIGSSLTILGNVTIGSGTTLDAGVQILNVRGNWTNSGGTFSQTGTGSVFFDGAAQTIGVGGGASTFRNVYISGSNNKTLSATMTVSGDMSILAGVNQVQLDASRNINGTASGTFSMNGGTFRTLQNFPNSFSTYNLTAGTVIFAQDGGSQSIPALNYANLTLQRNSGTGATTRSALGSINVAGNLTIGDVHTTLAMGNNTLTVTGNYVHTATAPQITWGATGTFVHNGAAWSISSNITSFNNLVLGGSGVKTMNGNLSVSGDVTVNSGVTLTMGTNTMTGTGTKVFSLNDLATVNCAIVAPATAIPASFGSYAFSGNSTYRINGAAAQNISNLPSYGNFDISTSGGNATLIGNTVFGGNFTMTGGTPTLADGGFNMTFSGASTSLRNYTPTAGTTVTFNGTNQSIVNSSPGAPDIFLHHVVLANTGTKSFTTSDMILGGNLTINSGVTLNSNQNFSVAGNLVNDGTISHTANVFAFTGTSAQAINPGTNTFAGVDFTGGGAKTINTAGLVVGNGQFNIDNSSLDLGALSHSIASAAVSFVGTGSWTTTNANLTFNRTTAQSIPGFTAQNVVFTGGGVKSLTAPISVSDLTLNSPASLDVDITDNHTITVRGNFLNSGATFQQRTGTVAFESNDGSAKTITNPTFYNVTFNQALTSARSYTITTNTAIQNSLTIGNGATLGLNGFTLTSGIAGAAGTVTVQTGGTLDVNANAQLLYNCTAGDGTLAVSGTLRLVGTSGNVATLSRSAGTNRIAANLLSGSTLNARFYQIQSLTDNGLDIDAGATVDNTNNLSDGTFSGINTSNTGGPYRYINFNSASTPTTTINNVTFNHGGTPTVGVSYNVARAGSASLITFDGAISGLLAGATYEDDPGNKIDWPLITASTWTGAVSSDWFTAGNWSAGVVPTSTTNVTIPLAANNPEIVASGATCRDITITNGILQVLGGFNLTVAGNATIGTGTSTANLVVETSATTIQVTGSWTRGTNGSYTANGSTVQFTGTTGTFTIAPLTSAFGNLSITGSATYLLSGAAVSVNGNLSQSAGVLNPNTASYVLTVNGDWNRSGGTFNTSTAGTVVLAGAGQTVTNGNFNALTVSGTGVKSTSGTVSVLNALTVNSTIAALSGSVITMQGAVTINSSGTFNGGTSTHNFSGLTWTGTGAYSTTGSTINFNRVGGTQTINASKFENLLFSGTATITVSGAVDVTGDVTVNSTIVGLNFGTNQLTRLSGPAGIFTVNGAVPITVTGANNFPNGFADYTLSAASTTNYSGTANQTIRGITYGNLTLTNANTKTLEGVTTVGGNLNFNTATLDVSSNNWDLTVNGNFNNNSTGSFICRTGTVTFGGSIAQSIALSLTGTKTFNRVVVANASATVTNTGVAMVVSNNLEVSSGTFSAGGLNVTVSGDLLALGTGAFANSGTITLNKPSGTVLISMNGSGVGTLVLAGGAATNFQAQDNLNIFGNMTVNSGNFNGLGRTIRVGTTGNALTVNGSYTMGAGGSLQLATNGSVTVGTAGVFNAIGTSSNLCTITRALVGATYSFTVNGTISARHYLFEYMGAGGVSISSTGVISTANNFSDGTFTNGASGGVMLRIENTQNLNGASRIENVKFLTNPGGGARNVAKTSALSGTVEMYNSTGPFAGASFENDPNNLINWTGPIILTWNGSVSTDWNTAANWTASSGPSIVPNASTDVIIAVSSNNPTVTGVDAEANNLSINTGAVLSITSATSSNTDLLVHNNLEISGFLIMSTTDDVLEVRGNWLRNGSGTFSPGQGLVRMGSISGTKTLNNGATAFFDLTIASNGTLQLLASTTVSRNLTIGGTATLDNNVASNFNLTVGGDLVNNGTWLPRNSLLTLNSSSVSRTFTPGSSTTLYDLTINAGAGSVAYTLGSDLSMTRNFNLVQGRLDLEGRTFTFGNNVGTPSFTVTGTLDVDANAVWRIGTGATINFNSGGRLNVIGTSSSAVATITRTVGGSNYVLNINTGSTIAAQFYLIEYTGTNGVHIKSGAVLDATNTLQNGTFSNGLAGGRYIRFENNFGANRTIANVVFNAGPTRNATRTSGAYDVFFQDASGALAGFSFEEDNLAPSATAGLLRWTYSYSLVTWNGSQTGGLWSNALNWTPNTVPTSTIGVVIPNVGNQPVIDADAECLNLTVNTGRTLTIQSDADLTVGDFLTNAGTITISGSSASAITVTGAWTNSGTFNPGTAGDVTFNAASGSVTINNGASSFNNLILNSSGSATFATGGSITVTGNLTITAGTLLVSNAAHALNVAGSWTHTGGTFTHGSGTVTFNGTGAGTQTITPLVASPFFNLTLSGNRTKQLGGNISVSNNMVISSGSNLNAGSHTMNLSRNFTATGATFTPGTSTIALVGSTAQVVTRTGGLNVYNLTLNNTSPTFPQITLSGSVTMNSGGTLTLTNGKMSTTASSILVLGNSNTISGASTNSYVSGPIRRVGSTDVTYPVGKGNVYAPIGLESLSGSATFVAEYFNSRAPQNLYALSGGLQRVSGVEYWDITREVGTATGQVRIFWTDGTRSRIGSGISSLRVAHWNGSQWENMGGTPSGSVAAGQVVSTTAFTSFSPIALSSENASENPLPVVYSSIAAKEVASGAELRWVTMLEQDADYYEVEYSRDNKTWERVGFVDAAGNTNSETSYTFTHEEKASGLRYYRLKQVDVNGINYEYSPVVQVLMGKDHNLTLTVKPNPAASGSELNYAIEGLTEGEVAELVLTNPLGQEVMRRQVTGGSAGVVSADMQLPAHLSQGIFMLNVHRGAQNKGIRVVIR